VGGHYGPTDKKRNPVIGGWSSFYKDLGLSAHERTHGPKWLHEGKVLAQGATNTHRELQRSYPEFATCHCARWSTAWWVETWRVDEWKAAANAALGIQHFPPFLTNAVLLPFIGTHTTILCVGYFWYHFGGGEYIANT
jgi:hypothetical protein